MFAAAALTGLLANQKLAPYAEKNARGEIANEWFTETAFAYAESMMKLIHEDDEKRVKYIPLDRTT